MSGDQRIVWLVLCLLMGFCFCIVLFFNGAVVDRSLQVGAKFSPRLGEWFKVLHDSIFAYTAYKRVLVLVFGLSVIIQISRVSGIFALGLSLGQQLSVVFYFIFVPIINLIAIIPISVAGIGIQEGSFVYFFSPVGMAPTDAFTLSVMGNIAVIISILPGGVFYLLQGITAYKSKSRDSRLTSEPSTSNILQ